MLNVTIEEFGETVILHCAGRIVRGHETAILCAAGKRHERKTVLDLSQVEAIDAAGIGGLISLQAAGIYLRLLNPTEAVREILRVTGLDSIFEICSSQLTESDKGGARQWPAAPLLAPVGASAS